MRFGWRPTYKATYKEKKKMVRLYTIEKKSLKEIGDMYGVHYATIKEILRNRGVELRPIKR